MLWLLLWLPMVISTEVAMLTLAVGKDYLVKVEPGLQSKREYCQYHQYTCVIGGDLDMTRPPPWSKIPFLQQHLPAHEVIFFSDADVVILDPHVRLESFVERMGAYPMMLTRDASGNLNTGNFFLRRSPEAFRLLEAMWNQTQFIHHVWWENMAFIHLYTTQAWVRAMTLVVEDYNAFNAYGDGHFLIHFAGIKKDLPMLMQKYGRERTRV